MTKLITQRPVGTIPAGTVIEADGDNAARFIASGDAVEVHPLAGAGADVGVRHRVAQEQEQAAVERAKKAERAKKTGR
ncbi:MAG: hypothetical protein AABM40_05805 [Chloroflexota bacterium]